jgi:hypothetical protein
MKNLALLAAAPIAAVMFAAPAAAQDSDNEKINIVDVFGQDACPESTGDVIVVCRRMDEEERYRIPEALRQIPGPTGSGASRQWVISARCRAAPWVWAANWAAPPK